MNHKQEELTSADYDRVWAKDEILFIDSAEGLASLADTLGLRSDWHEPDESDVTATLVNPTYKGGNLFNLRETKIRHLDRSEYMVCRCGHQAVDDEQDAGHRLVSDDPRSAVPFFPDRAV